MNSFINFIYSFLCHVKTADSDYFLVFKLLIIFRQAFSMIAIKAFEIGTFKGPYIVKASGIKDYNVIGSRDWADEEDDRMFRKLGGKWRRIMG